ncbi:MAG: response regulator transcription factor [Saprospiraceae bacterium]|nr:response regulator transcription factor [Saprospiraceae bacterium]
MIKILIADDHKMFVDGIDSILKNEKDFTVVDRCYDGPSIFKSLEDHEVDVILLDVNLPGMTGIEVTERLQKEKPGIRILALSMYNEESFVSEILKKGALGYILKNTGRSELVTGIRTVFSGESYFSKDVTETIMSGLMKKQKAGNNTLKKSVHIPKISRREKEVLALIAKEFTTQEIAEKLFISLKTVESHRSSLLSKLNARNSAGLVRIALENNLLES